VRCYLSAGFSSTMPGMENWNSMDQAARDAAYNNTAGVAGSADIVAGWRAASARLREARPEKLDIPYGPAERQKWDLFPGPDPAAPCLVFIHGGYWQRNARDGFACMAEGALARGWSAALPGYTLAPQASLSELVAEIRAALDWLAAHGAAQGIAGPRILSGWSAGGHLAACAADHPSLAGTLAISGVFELAPIRDTDLDAALSLSDADIETCSPLRAPAGSRIAVAWGARELPGLVWQSEAFVAARAGLPGGAMPIAGADHFSVLEHLRHPQGALLSVAATLAQGVTQKLHVQGPAG
jgi:arylformamidase